MSRPRIEFPWNIVDALMSFPINEAYLAKYLLKKEGLKPVDIDKKSIAAKVKLIQRRIKERWGLSFVQYREQKQEDWNMELMELQRKACRKLNPTMLIFMGKQCLGQSDKIQQKNEVTLPEGGHPAQVVIQLPDNGRTEK